MNLNLSQNLQDSQVRKQFQDLTSQISAGWDREHLPDGTHGVITTKESIVAGGTATFLSQPRLRLITTSAAIPPATIYYVPWRDPGVRGFVGSGAGADNNQYMSPGWQFKSGDPTTLIFPEDGLYHCRCNLIWDSGATGAAVNGGMRLCRFEINNLFVEEVRDTASPNVGGDSHTTEVSMLWPFRRGDTLRILLYHTAAAPIGYGVLAPGQSLMICKLG